MAYFRPKMTIFSKKCQLPPKSSSQNGVFDRWVSSVTMPIFPMYESSFVPSVTLYRITGTTPSTDCNSSDIHHSRFISKNKNKDLEYFLNKKWIFDNFSISGCEK